MSKAHIGTKVRISAVSKHSPSYAWEDTVLNKEFVLTEEPKEVVYPESRHTWNVLVGFFSSSRHNKVILTGVDYEVL